MSEHEETLDALRKATDAWRGAGEKIRQQMEPVTKALSELQAALQAASLGQLDDDREECEERSAT